MVLKKKTQGINVAFRVEKQGNRKRAGQRSACKGVVVKPGHSERLVSHCGQKRYRGVERRWGGRTMGLIKETPKVEER